MKKILHSGMWVFSSNLIIRIIALVITPILARNFLKEDLSVFRSLQSIVLIVFTLIPLGTNLLYISEKKEEREKYWPLFLIASSLTTLLAVAVLYVATLKSYKGIPLMPYFIILIPLSSFLKNVFTAKYTEQIMFKEISLSILFRQIALYSLIILFTCTNKTIEGLIIALLISEIIEVMSLSFFSKGLKNYFIDFKRKVIFDKKARNFTIYTGGANTIINLSLQLPSVLVLSLLGKELAVEFQMPLVLVAIPVTLLIKSVTSVLFPYLSNNRGDNQMQKVILNTQYIFFITGFPICFFMFFFSNELSALLFNPEWQHVAFALKLLSIANIFNILQNPLSQICLIKNHPMISFYYAIALLVFRMIGLYLGYYLYGFMGSVFVFVLFDSLVRLIRLNIDIRLISLTARDYLKNIKKPLAIIAISSIIYALGLYLDVNHYLLFISLSIIYATGTIITDKQRIFFIMNSLRKGLKDER